MGRASLSNANVRGPFFCTVTGDGDMTNRQKLEVRSSELRTTLNDLAGVEGELTDEQRGELDAAQTEYRSTEEKLRAAIMAEGVTETRTGPDAEERERRELRSKARVSDFVSSALTGRPVGGASGEYAAAVGVPGLMPLDLLSGPEVREVETRAVTPGPANETVAATRPTVPYAFARTDAAALGIAMPMVPPGAAHFPALSTAPPAGPKAVDGAADQTAAAFTLTKREPKRITGSFLIRLEDLALLPSMETDLRQGIASAMADSLDGQVINGSGAGANLSGLFHQATDQAIAGATETFSTAIERYAGVVDGKHANGFGDVRALIGVDTFAKYAAIFANADKGDLSGYDVLMAKLGALRVSTRVPAKSGNGQKGICVLTAQGQPITVPVWTGVELIVDPYTQAAQGQRVVTAVSLVGSPFVPYGAAQVVEVHPKIS